MTNTSTVNLSQKINPAIVEVLRTVKGVCVDLGVPWVIVGATARDLVLHYGYGAQIKRATHDMDFAIEVAEWETFERVKQQLVERGFSESKTQHRLYGPENETIDLVPFGQIENKDSVIAWPPRGEVAMNVLGFSEACEHADNVTIDDESGFTVPVATPVGMVLLKIIAWTDRAPDIRRKDAADIKYIFENYELISSVQDEAYDAENEDTMANYDWDLTLACIHLLGRHARQIANEETNRVICSLFAGEIKQRQIEKLKNEMSQNQLEEERNQQMIEAYSAGFQEK